MDNPDKSKNYCPACGYALGGEVEPDDDDEEIPSNLDETATDPEEERKRYVSAIKGVM